MSRFRPSKGPVLAGLALCLILAAVCYGAQQPLSPAAGPAAIPASTDNWGLSFPQEGQTPVGNASPEELAKVLKTHHTLGLKGGILVANPIPQAYSMDADAINAVIDQAVAEADEKGIHGKQTTPFLLAKVKEITGGDSLEANIQLVFNNAKLAAQTAVAYSALS